MWVRVWNTWNTSSLLGDLKGHHHFGEPSAYRMPFRLNVGIAYDPAIIHLGVYPAQTHASTHQEAGVRTFLAALFVLIPTGNHTNVHHSRTETYNGI